MMTEKERAAALFVDCRGAWEAMSPALRHIRKGDLAAAEKALVRAMNRMCRQVQQAENILLVPEHQRVTEVDKRSEGYAYYQKNKARKGSGL